MFKQRGGNEGRSQASGSVRREDADEEDDSLASSSSADDEDVFENTLDRRGQPPNKGNTLTRLTRIATAKSSVRVSSLTLSRVTQLVAGESFRTSRYSSKSRSGAALRRRPAFRLSRQDLADLTEENELHGEEEEFQESNIRDTVTKRAKDVPDADSVVQHVVQPAAKRVAKAEVNLEVKLEMVEDEKAEYWCSCLPPRVFMAVISAAQIAMFIWYPSVHKLDSPLPYLPDKRQQVWRLFTYCFIHTNTEHLVVNMVVQLILGVFLELFFWWQVFVIYCAGVISGGLAHSVLQPTVRAVGASGGVSALVTAHVAKVVVNFAEMKRTSLRLRNMVTGKSRQSNKYEVNKEEDEGPTKLDMFLPIAGGLVWLTVALGLFVEQVILAAINSRERVSYSAHLGGALCGIFLGCPLLILNMDSVKKKVFSAVCFSIFACLVVVTVILNIIQTRKQ